MVDFRFRAGAVQRRTMAPGGQQLEVSSLGGQRPVRVARWHTLGNHFLGKSVRQDGSQLVFLQRGSDRFQVSTEQIPAAAAVAQAPDGRLWVSDADRGARQLPEFPLPGISPTATGRALNSVEFPGRPPWFLTTKARCGVLTPPPAYFACSCSRVVSAPTRRQTNR